MTKYPANDAANPIRRAPVAAPDPQGRPMRILVIEDDAQTANYIAKGLREEGFAVDIASDGKGGLVQALGEDYNVAIVDRMLPAVDGLTIVEMLRKANKSTAVLFLSAMGDLEDRVTGLKAGGDDYLVKPFAFSELLARVRALLRRHGGQGVDTSLRTGDLVMDLLTRSVTRGGRAIDLQPREFRLLEYLMRHSGQVVTRTMMLENVWGYHFDPQTNVIDVHISRLRQKIDRDFDKPLVHTIRGVGYSLRAPD
jgi:two-component system OmpR family response regulator